MGQQHYRIFFTIVVVLFFCQTVWAEKFTGDESNSVYSFIQTSSSYYYGGYQYTGYSNPMPPQDLGQYSDPISAINAYNQNNIQNTNSVNTYSGSNQPQYQYITPGYQNDITMRTLQEISNPQQYQYITLGYGNPNDVTMRTMQEIQNPQQYQYITPISPNVHCYRSSPDAAEVCSS
jgi:hypothetical protein